MLFLNTNGEYIPSLSTQPNNETLQEFDDLANNYGIKDLRSVQSPEKSSYSKQSSHLTK
tara:strand:- start:5 stop:181 length:177 start_codon:yes stop_codon:yes gene_type:complete